MILNVNSLCFVQRAKNKVKSSVLITGASTGIGAACTHYLAQRGFHVIAGVRRTEDGESLRQTSADISPIILDVTHPDHITAAAQSVQNMVSENGLAGLINNAGIATAGPLEFLPIDELRYQLEVNTIGLIALTQAVLPFIRQAKGRIINMSSFGGSISSPFLGPYHASKFALEALSDALRMELRPWGIHVSVIKPAAVSTPIWNKAIDDSSRFSEKVHDYYGYAFDTLTRNAQEASRVGVEASAVAAVVHRALTAPKPKTRYLIGFNPLVYAVLQMLPDRWRDRLILKNLGLSIP
ncbi:MAG: SDR family oxidoreductase [Anaerolineales bacterium]|nr:SDR family oxidoreductase [Anaerolineales bacterium]